MHTTQSQYVATLGRHQDVHGRSSGQHAPPPGRRGGARPRAERVAAVVCWTLLSVAPVLTPAHGQDLRLSAQVRPRLEIWDPVLPAGTRDDFISMRTRLGVAGTLQDNVSLLVQVQDVRMWGDDRALVASTGLTELHQGFIAVSRVLDRDITLRAGRQEIQLGSSRLVGNGDWGQRARAFDGVRTSFGFGEGNSLDVFATRTADRTAARPVDAGFHGIHGTARLSAGVTGDAYALYTRSRASTTRTDQGTAGGRLAATTRAWLAEVEAALQVGERNDTDVSAWMLRANAGPVLLDGRARIVFSVEHYSGHGPGDDDIRAFDVLFGTAHRFLGYADLFTNLPVHTGGRGVRELAVRSSVVPLTNLEILASVHSFQAANSDGLSSSRFGEELDVRVQYRWRAPLTVIGGTSYVWQGPALAEIGRLDRDLSWIYLMLNATL